MDTDSFVLSVTTKDFIKDFKNLEDIYSISIIWTKTMKYLLSKKTNWYN